MPFLIMVVTVPQVLVLTGTQLQHYLTISIVQRAITLVDVRMLEIGNLKSGLLQGLKLSINYGFDLINSAGATYYNPYNGNSVAVKGTLQKSMARVYSYTFESNFDLRS